MSPSSDVLSTRIEASSTISGTNDTLTRRLISYLKNNRHIRGIVPYVKGAIPAGIVFSVSQLVEKIGTFEQYPSIDIPFHMLGGYAIAHAIDTISNKTSTVSSIMLRTLLIGFAWEVYELMRGLDQTGFTPASGKDIIMDMVGARLYILFSQSTHIHKSHPHN